MIVLWFIAGIIVGSNLAILAMMELAASGERRAERDRMNEEGL